MRVLSKVECEQVIGGGKGSMAIGIINILIKLYDIASARRSEKNDKDDGDNSK